MRYDRFGDLGSPISRMAHNYNNTVTGVMGYMPQNTQGASRFDRIPGGGSFVAEGDISSPYGNNLDPFDSFGGE